MAHTEILSPASFTTERILKGIARLVLSVVFLAAVVGKLLDPSLFLGFVAALFGVGTSGAKVLFLTTICLEAYLGVALLLIGQRPWTYLLSGFVFLLFAGVIGYAIVIDLEATCGCFGAFLEAQEANPISLIRNVLMTAIALFMAVELQNEAHTDISE